MYHYIIGDKMEKQLLWELFKNTGKIEYYLRYKELDINGSNSRENI